MMRQLTHGCGTVRFNKACDLTLKWFNKAYVVAVTVTRKYGESLERM